MSVQLPEKPWTKGDSFKVEETGLTYVWSGEAWLSDGADLDVTDFDDRYVKQSGSWDMKLGTSLSVNVLKNIDGGTPFVYYDGDPEGTHPCGIVNRYMLHDYVEKKIDDLKAELDQQRFDTVLHDSPFVSSTNNAQLWYTSNSSVMPGHEQLYGIRYDGSSMTANQYPANWNSGLRLGTGIIALDQNGSKINIPLDYEEDWTGTVSIYQFETDVADSKTKLSLVFKNSVHSVRRAASNGIVYITFGKTADGKELHHPIFGRGDLQGDLKDKRVIVMLDVYRIGDRYDPLGDGVRTQPIDQKG